MSMSSWSEFQHHAGRFGSFAELLRQKYSFFLRHRHLRFISAKPPPISNWLATAQTTQLNGKGPIRELSLFLVTETGPGWYLLLEWNILPGLDWDTLANEEKMSGAPLPKAKIVMPAMLWDNLKQFKDR